MIRNKFFKALIIFFYFLNGSFAYGKFENKIIVKVDKGIITTHDVQNEIKVFLNGSKPRPNDNIEINSLSLFNLLKHKSNPNININGAITLIIFGIR